MFLRTVDRNHPLKAAEVGEEGNAVDRSNMSMIHIGSNWKVNQCLAQPTSLTLSK